MRFHPTIRTIVSVALVAAACESTTEPKPDFDGTKYPYSVSTGGMRLFGTSRVLIIPARFVDGAPPPLTSAEIQAQLFAGPNGGALNQSFNHASGGRFTLRGTVTNWVNTTVPRNFSGTPVHTTARGDDYVWEALQGVEDEIDFGRFDNDGPDGFPNSGDDDGIVDGGVAILNSEFNRYCNGGTGLGPHPFARPVWRINNAFYQTADSSARGGRIQVDGYTLMSVNGCGGLTVAVHVLAHELGHLLLGLPDLYHALGGQGEVWATRRWVYGCWDLMAAGSWGCGTGAPTLDYRFNTLGAWTRLQLGWSVPVLHDLAKDTTYDLHPMGRGGTVLRLPIAAGEYLLLEYREAAPGDAKIPANGVLISHIAESLTQFPQNLQASYRVSLIEADDDSTLFKTELQGGNRGTASDAFGYARTSFRNGEHTRARAVDGLPLPFEIAQITIDGAAHEARVRVRPAAGVAARVP
jgi:M6 family metalloprotease-like protein